MKKYTGNMLKKSEMVETLELEDEVRRISKGLKARKISKSS